jgi:hypothetical protein
MAAIEKLVAIISPWENLSQLVKDKFRIESLPAEKKVMVWREDLQEQGELTRELSRLGIKPAAVRSEKVTARWQDVE